MSKYLPMQNPKNRFKSAIANGTRQLGVWNTIGGNTVPELLGGAGFDWVLVDCEHAAIETIEVLPALQAIGQNPDTSAVARVASNDATLFKRVLDMGAQTVMVPSCKPRRRRRQPFMRCATAPKACAAWRA